MLRALDSSRPANAHMPWMWRAIPDEAASHGQILLAGMRLSPRESTSSQAPIVPEVRALRQRLRAEKSGSEKVGRWLVEILLTGVCGACASQTVRTIRSTPNGERVGRTRQCECGCHANATQSRTVGRACCCCQRPISDPNVAQWKGRPRYLARPPVVDGVLGAIACLVDLAARGRRHDDVAAPTRERAELVQLVPEGVGAAGSRADDVRSADQFLSRGHA
jgi:hypothetical protein